LMIFDTYSDLTHPLPANCQFPPQSPIFNFAVKWGMVCKYGQFMLKLSSNFGCKFRKFSLSQFCFNYLSIYMPYVLYKFK
jgi:hypothetical protein